MKKVGFFYNSVFLEHRTSPGHPESPKRLEAIITAVKNDPLSEELVWVDMFPRRAPESLYKVHTRDYVAFVEKTIADGAAVLDFGDTTVSEKSYLAALTAADAVVDAVDQVHRGVLDNAFCAVRPPGHHAERDKAMGFCIFNNIAVGATHLFKSGVKRVAIVDWDVHHGNGTQHAFQKDGRVLFVSLHQYPHYPGTGSAHETGFAKGKGMIKNFPMRSDAGNEEYIDAFHKEIVPALDEFKPQFILISAGFDGHKNDPLASVGLDTETFVEFTRILMDSAEKHCDGKVVSVLEGGYDLQALGESVVAHLKEMMK